MKTLHILLLGILIISFTSAGLFDNYQVRVSNIGTSNEDLTLTTSKGEINTYLVRESIILNRWVRVRGMFYSEYEDRGGKRIKFGNSDSDVAFNFISKYRYYFTSTMPYYEKEGYYFFYDGNVSNKAGFIHIDLTDICSRQFSGISADCKITMEKKNRVLLPDLYIIMVEFNSDRNIDPDFAGGSGTSIDPYQITNWTALRDIKDYRSSYFILMNDLNMSTSDYAGIGDSWSPIGNSSTTTFTGNFEGNGYTISDYRVTGSAGYLSLFGYVQTGTGRYVQNFNVRNATIIGSGTGQYIGAVTALLGTTGRLRGVNVSESNVTGYQYVGGVNGGQSSGSLLDNCMYNGSVRANYRTAGGITAYATSTNSVLTKITNVRSYGTIYSASGGGNSYVGGIVGLHTGTLQNGYTEMNVTGLGNYVGGAVGQITNYNQIINITANNKVSCTLNSCGGIIGGGTVAPNTATNVKFDKLYFYGNVTSMGDYLGGIIGSLTFTNYNYPAQINNSYFGGSINATGTNKLYVGGLIGYAYSGNASHNFIQNSVSNGTIISKSNYTGGLIGRTYQGGGLNSYSMSNITCTHFCSSGIGYIIRDGNFSNIYSAGFVNGSGVNVTGLVSLINTTANINLFNSYWDINSTGQTTSELGTGYTTEQMKNFSNFANWSILESNIDLNNGYPYLGWQGSNTSSVWLIYKAPISSFCWFKENGALIMPFVNCGIDGIMDIGKILKEAFG